MATSNPKHSKISLVVSLDRIDTVEAVKTVETTQYSFPRNAFVQLVREDSWSLYADGFKRAAELLIENVSSTYEINTVVFPILFLYRVFPGSKLDFYTSLKGALPISLLSHWQ